MSEHDRLPGPANITFVEGLYAGYLRDPSSVPREWREYFQGLHDGEEFRTKPKLGPSFRPSSLFNPPVERPRAGEASSDEAKTAALQERVDMLIRCYRVRGHMIARLDPLEQPQQQPPELDPTFYEFTESDMDRRFSCDTLGHGELLPLREIIQRLRNTYCRSIGVQFMHMDDLSVRQWLQERMEPAENRLALSREEQIRILTRLTDAVTFEEFIRKKFVGSKSFSLEGSESLIPLLALAIEKAGEQGIDEIVLGMAHRGRLNVLANIIGKSPREIFREFEDADPQSLQGRGDVKYHLGYSNDWKTAVGRTVHLSLCFNPSHVEFVNTVALGRMRAKQDRAGDANRERGMVLLIHGDAAFAAEGIAQETLNLSQLSAYSVGGTLHVVINNQIGYTTSPSEARSSTYATDIAKMLQSPIFHVNGEDPEAVAQVVRLAMDFRKEFKRDVVIDMYGYRRLGHNEGDEPSFTQPVLYRAIAKRKSVREGYLEHLLALNELTREEADEIAEQRRKHLEAELSAARDKPVSPPSDELRGIWKGYLGGPEAKVPETETGVEKKRLAVLLETQTKFPQDFHPHPKIVRGVKARLEMARGERPVDWSAGESLAFATLATEGCRIRLCGQDSERGTFSHRHAVLHDYENGHIYVPLQHLGRDQAVVDIYNSPLSELGALGFEYGYSLDCPDGLVLWEAQFGDFVNAAQVIIDQFIASAEDKWRRLSGLVLLLPHGFEGMGPEHSSARLERFLQVAAEDNIQVVYPTTPAQYFHCLRRQMLRRWRKPLVVMTPKSLLRHEKAVSKLEELANGTFQRILPDARATTPSRVKRVLFCTGKIYYELEKQREELKRDDVAILRLEQLYPLRDEVLQSALACYPDKTPVVWVQEEPENMGAWHYLHVRFGETLFQRLPFSGVCRPASASPATGSAAAHKAEQRQILARAFGGS
jgi:2-oxoglutarate dehydrogenase E1 component